MKDSKINGKKAQKGFTLIELLVVIAIIGLLASVVLVSLNSARQKSRDAKRIADINQIAKAYELFFNDNSSYPTNSLGVNTWGTLMQGTTSGGGAVTTNGTGKALAPGYIGLIPTAPTPADGTCTTANNSYTTLGSAAGTNVTASYYITFCLGAQTGGYAAGVHTLTPSGVQ